ncbi:hypothetical protein J0S82_001874, partial [Galemys pyrenaicus]
ENSLLQMGPTSTCTMKMTSYVNELAAWHQYRIHHPLPLDHPCTHSTPVPCSVLAWALLSCLEKILQYNTVLGFIRTSLRILQGIWF